MVIWTIIEAILEKLAADEIKAWLPNISRRFLRLTVALLSEDRHAESAKEWAESVIDTPGEVSQFIHAMGLFAIAIILKLKPAARRMSDFAKHFKDVFLDIFQGRGLWMQDLFN